MVGFVINIGGISNEDIRMARSFDVSRAIGEFVSNPKKAMQSITGVLGTNVRISSGRMVLRSRVGIPRDVRTSSKRGAPIQMPPTLTGV